jgi:hypothetical protein
MGPEQGARGGQALAELLTDWEVHYLWWFVVDAAIMVPETRWQLRRSFGWCARHAWGGLAVQAGLTRGYLHGLAILYDDLLRWANGRLWGGRWAWRRALVARPCPLCGSEPQGGGRSASADLLRRGRDPAYVDALVVASKGRWAAWRCGVCDGSGFPWWCRPHLVAALEAGQALDLARIRDGLTRLGEAAFHYARGFRLEFQGTTGAEEVGAFLGAVGWCSGFGPFLAAYGCGRDDA